MSLLPSTPVCSALLLNRPWLYSPALAPLAERVFQCVAREGRGSAQGAGWRGSRKHHRTESFGSSELLCKITHQMVTSAPGLPNNRSSSDTKALVGAG